MMKIKKPTDNELRKYITRMKYFQIILLICGYIFLALTLISIIGYSILACFVAMFGVALCIVVYGLFDISQTQIKIRLEIRGK